MFEKELLEAVLSLFRYTLNGTLPDSSMLDGLTEETVHECCRFADRFDLAHLVCYALEKLERLPQGERYRKKLLEAFWRFERLTYERKRIASVLEQAQIDHIFLKAPVLQPLYPEPWLRPSADVDVLVKEADHSKAMALLCEKMGCTRGKRTAHDVELLLANDFHAEVHFALMDEQTSIEQTLSRVWDGAVGVPGKQYEKQLSPEMFYFFYIAHMMRHFMHGGCGIKPFLDLWLMRDGIARDERIEPLLRANGLLSFETEARRLAEYWLGGGEPGSCTAEFEQFILSGGMYGSVENKVSAYQLEYGSRGSYYLRRLIAPRDVLEKRYPILREKGWMLPIMQMRRWGESVTDGKLALRMREISASRKTADRSTQKLMKDLGLL